MSLQASKHQERAKRPEGKLPQLDPVALDELGMTQAEVEGFAARLHGWVVLPGMKDYPAAAAPHAAPRWPGVPADHRVLRGGVRRRALPRAGPRQGAVGRAALGPPQPRQLLDLQRDDHRRQPAQRDHRRSGGQDGAGRRGRELRAAQRGARRLRPARPGRDVRRRRRRRVHAGRRLRAHVAALRDRLGQHRRGHGDARRRHDRRGRRDAQARPVVGGAGRDRQPVRGPARADVPARRPAVGLVLRAALDARGRARRAGRDPARVHARRRQ